MCGIAGMWGFKDEALVKRFSKLLEHRGPDGEGIYTSGSVTLLNRRLAIIDRAGGNQPIFNETKSVVTVYNGEIYNYRELREELVRAGHTFRTESDTEVIVHGYEEWGTQCFDRFNGMFAVALYDIRKKKLILARDHFGIKPLYYALSPKQDRFVFASEIKPLLENAFLKIAPNDRIIYRYLQFRIHDESKETFFRNIFKVMPGEVLTISTEGVEHDMYSDLQNELLKPTHKRYARSDAESFKNILVDSVRMRLMSEVPVGTCLSGGLDSSAVVSIIHSLLEKNDVEAHAVGVRQNTFSAIFPGAGNNEEKYIDELVRKLKTVRVHKVFPDSEDFVREMKDFVRTQEEPTVSTGPYAQFKVMEEVRKHVTVVLDGQGADEMLAGYLPYYVVYVRSLLRQGRYIDAVREVFFSFDIFLMLLVMKVKMILSHDKSVKARELMNPAFARTYADESFHPVTDDLKKRLVQDIFANSLPSLLRYEDKNSMKFSVEGRVPFLDFRLVRYIFGLTEDAIIRYGWNKYLLRMATKQFLPRLIRKRRNKIGFTTPEYDWFHTIKPQLYEIVLSQSFANRPYFDQQKVLKVLHSFVEGKMDDTLLLWRIINVELWLREFFDHLEKSDEQKAEKPVVPEITAGEKSYIRHLIQTGVFAKGDDFSVKISSYVNSELLSKKEIPKRKWYVFVSEKVVAIAQGRSHFVWDIKPGFAARHLYPLVTKSPYGIGLRSPWTMQLAIDEAGLLRILTASVVAAVTRPLGIKGMFYRIAGSNVSAIDGPTEYSLYPSNVSAKLGPKNPKESAFAIRLEIERGLTDQQRATFGGLVIIDANDIGRNILGNATDVPDSILADIFRDNPMGQGKQQTPLAIVTEQR